MENPEPQGSSSPIRGWGGEAPLWFYILKEAEIVGKGREVWARSAGAS